MYKSTYKSCRMNKGMMAFTVLLLLRFIKSPLTWLCWSLTQASVFLNVCELLYFTCLSGKLELKTVWTCMLPFMWMMCAVEIL
jgi:hypothetical protein